MTQETAVAETKSHDLATNTDAWGQNEMSSRDIIIPKVLVMQGLSQMVTDGKAKFGDFVDSVSGEVLGSIDKPINFVPFHMEKVWIVSTRQVGTDKYEFDAYEKITPANEDRRFEEIIGNTQFKYEYCQQFYVLLENDPTMPYILAFKSTSSRAGKALSTQMFVRNKAGGKTPPAVMMALSGVKEKNEKGTYAVMNVAAIKETSQELLAAAFDWYKMIQAGKTKAAPEKSGSQPNYATDDSAKF